MDWGALREPAYSDEAMKRLMKQWESDPELQYHVEQNARFLKTVPNFAEVQKNACSTLIHPRVGVACIKEQKRQLERFKQAGSAVLSFQVDSLTRLGAFSKIDAIFEAQTEKEPGQLNGLPMVNYGVRKLRPVAEGLHRALQTRHSARDARLLCEISYASGVTGFEGGPISYNLPYYRDFHPAEALQFWRYVDRLGALYWERFGIAMDREFFGPLTGTLMPPSLAIVVNILESMVAAKQGARHFTLGLGETGHRIQDIASLAVVKPLVADFLKQLDVVDAQLCTVFHQYMAAFPQDLNLARELIMQSAKTCMLGGADRIIVKTPVEAFKIPSLEDNLEAIKLVEAGFGLADFRPVDFYDEVIGAEMDLISKEVHQIMDAMLGLGCGNLNRAIVAGIREGILDIPFVISSCAVQKTLTIQMVRM